MKISGRLLGLAAAATLADASASVAIAHGAGAATETLLSQGRPATASSVETAALGPANAVDGNAGTRWGSKEGVGPQWIRVDLGGSHAITHVTLKWEAAFGKAYKIEISADGDSWQSVFSTTNGNGGTDDLTGLSGSGRFVRLTGTARGIAFGYSLFEFQVFGTGGSTPPPPPPPPPGPPPPPPPPPPPRPPPPPPPGGHVLDPPLSWKTYGDLYHIEH